MLLLFVPLALGLSDFAALTAGRTNLNTLPDVWCFQLDSSHPTIAATYGDCEGYYATDVKFPGGVNLCAASASKRGPSSGAGVHTDDASSSSRNASRPRSCSTMAPRDIASATDGESAISITAAAPLLLGSLSSS